MNSMHRDFLILILLAGGVFAVIYGWMAYNAESVNNSGEPEQPLSKDDKQEDSLFGEEFEERLAAAFEEHLSFIHNEYSREFESTLRQRFDPHLEGSAGIKGINVISGEQINAFTTFGDQIYLFDGLITQIDDPLLVASIVAHELGHIHHNHIEERLKMAVGTSLLATIISGGNQGMIMELGRTIMSLSFNRSQELEADHFARSLLEQADIHPHHLSRAFLRMKTLTNHDSSPDFLSSHPSQEERIERILEYKVPDEFEERPLQFPWQDFVQSLQ